MKKIIILGLLTIPLFLNISFTNKEIDQKTENSYKDTIRQIFSNWQLQEIRTHHFLAKDSCSPNYIYEHIYCSKNQSRLKEYENNRDNGWGFPDSAEIHYSFADINDDGQLDGLITFVPEQCDGGNASMWIQLQLLIVSNKGKYDILDNFIDDIIRTSDGFNEGFCWIDSIATNKLFGTYYQYQEGDGANPSIESQIVIYFDAKKIKVIDDPIPGNSLPSDSITSDNYYQLLVGKYLKVDSLKNPFLFINNALANKPCDLLIENKDHYNCVIQKFTKVKFPIELGPKPEPLVKNLQIINDSIFITKSLCDKKYFKTESGDRTARYYYGCILDTNSSYDLCLVPYINCCGNDYFLYTINKNGEMIDRVSIGGFWNDTSETYSIMGKSDQFDVYRNDFVFKKNGRLFLVNRMHFNCKITKTGKFEIE